MAASLAEQLANFRSKVPNNRRRMAERESALALYTVLIHLHYFDISLPFPP